MTDVFLPTQSDMAVISLWQPWAQFVALGWKTIETRTHQNFASLAGRRIGIHAALMWDTQWLRHAGPYMTKEQIEETDKFDRSATGGRILCTAHVTGHRSLDEPDSQAALISCHIRDRFGGACSLPRYGLLLKDVKRLADPFKIKGKQGIFYVPGKLCA